MKKIIGHLNQSFRLIHIEDQVTVLRGVIIAESLLFLVRYLLRGPLLELRFGWSASFKQHIGQKSLTGILFTLSCSASRRFAFPA